MARILVTGADGFTGRHLCQALLDQGDEVHGLVRSTAGKQLDDRIQFHCGDLEEQKSLGEILRNCQPEKIVHLAAISFVAHDDPGAIYRTNLCGTRNLLDAVAAEAAHLSAILLASSANIYGNQQCETLDESVGPAPANDYAVSKIAMEYMATLFRERIPIIIARPFNYTGLGQSKNFLVPKIVDYVINRCPTIELGNIDIERDWSDVRFVVQAYRRLLETPAAVGRTVNICSGTSTSLRAVLQIACQLAGHEIAVKVNPALIRTNEIRSLRGDNSLLRELIGDLPTYTIDETLRWMICGH
jgi:nucleoside-diphosphate-sugar epimerase